MALESGTSIEDLNPSWPVNTDLISAGDDHLRLIKNVMKATFPGSGGNGFNIPITATEVEINHLAGITEDITTSLTAITSDIGDLQTGKVNKTDYDTEIAAINTELDTKLNITDAPNVAGITKNLVIRSDGTAQNVVITADTVSTEKTTFEPFIARSISKTVNLAASGLLGLDTGSAAASTWYYVWIISNGTDISAILSLSSTNPTMPTGYIYKARVGSCYNMSDSKIRKYVQKGKLVNYKSSKVLIASGRQGSTPTTWYAASLLTSVPPTAIACSAIIFDSSSTGTTALAESSSCSTDSASYGTNPPLYRSTSGTTSTSAELIIPLDADTNLYYMSTDASANNSKLFVTGYTEL